MITVFIHNGLTHKIKRSMMTILIIALVASGSLGSFNGKAQASSDFIYYVAVDGDDSNPGTLSQPFATLAQAQNAIRTLKTSTGLPAGGVKVYLRGGEYIQSTTFTLTPDDSGSEGSPIVYQSYPGETAIISSKQEITGWSLLEDSYPAGLPESAEGKVFVASISPGWRFHSMFVNDVSQPVAKSFQNTDWTTWPVLTAAGSPSPSGRSITFPQGVLDHIPSNRDVEVSMTTAWWWNIVAPIDSIDQVNNTAKLQSKAPVQFENLFALAGGHYNILNALPVLDQAGEWVVDSAAGKVYYWPSDGTMSGKTVFAPKLNEILRLQGDEEAQNWTNQVQYVEFRNLQFMYSDRTPEDQYNPDWLVRNAENPDAMIYMQGVSHIVMDSNLIAYSGSQGIALDHYAQNVTLTRNEIAYSSSGGIQITGYGPGDVDVNKNHIIERNHVHHVGLDYMHSGPLSIYGSNNNTIKYNYFHDSPYAGISIVGTHYEPMNDPAKVDTTDSYGNNQAFYQMRWTEVAAHRPYDPFTAIPYMHSSDNTVQYNIVDNYMEALHDGGALYTWSAGTNTLWDHNVGTSPSNKGVSIYFDNHTAYNTASNNIFWSPGDGFFNNSGNSTNTSTNNVIMDINKPPGYDILRNTIINTVNAQGGWLGAALSPVEIPTSATDIHEAENYDTAQGAQTEDGGTGKYVGLASEGDFVGYKNIDFGEVNSINQINVSVAVDPAHAGKQLEVRLDSITGELIGTLTLNDTGGLTTFTTQTASITDASGVRDLFIVAKGSGSGFLNMDWFTFSTKATSIIQAEIFSASHGVQTGVEDTVRYLGWIDGGDWIGYYNIDFGSGQLDQFQVSAAVDPGYAGKELELRLDSITGPLIGTYTFNNTGGFTTFQTQTIPISGASGVHHLFLVTKGSGVGYGSIDWFTFKNSNAAKNATLESIMVGGTVLAGFSSEKDLYHVALPFGTTVVPDVTATATEEKATVNVKQASELPGTTEIVVTSEDGTRKMTYKINFTVKEAPKSNDATLSGIVIGGTALAGFSSEKNTYDVTLPTGTTTVPEVTATATDTNAAIQVIPASNLPGTTAIEVIAADGKTKLTYKINFTVQSLPYNPGPASSSGESTEVEKGVLTVKPEQIVVRNGKATIEVPTGSTKVKLPYQTPDLLGSTELELKMNNITIGIPAATIKQLVDSWKAAGRKEGTLVLELTPLLESDIRAFIAQGERSMHAAINPSGAAYHLNLYITAQDGKSETLKAYHTPVKLRLPVANSINPKLAAIYYIADDGSLEYVGGQFSDSNIVAEIGRSGRYVVLELTKQFDDIAPNFWAADVIKELAAKQIITGTSANIFEPGRSITRAEFTSLLVRALKLQNAGEMTFTDVKQGDWYAEAISIAVKAGIAGGKTTDRFDPNAQITREEMVTMLIRAYDVAHGQIPAGEGSVVFTDEGNISKWAVESVKTASSLQLIKGRTTGSFDPQGIASRAEAAQMIYNLLSLKQ